VELDACKSEIKLIPDENGLHFRRKVQNIMADKLLSQANQILEKLSGRYYVRKVESEHGLAIEIEDTKQHNMRRMPKTLSGGESFIVSLALALGLAEMANNGHAVESLFLDEGFGNLDAESLYLAMTTLESLKTHGKVVGVISHVEGVHKRIKTQIEMIKKPNGLSALKMVS
jgi:exonuclease SbcC